ncbi:WD40 repeat-like protein [Dacryopinax primogenitus]|uniref:WD40 repeat-like protein n=1 Tax=Dacryopinax primogenitus (strain DJM 731) TaxID=1858805 RepID=M5FU56_DACPD|nr:WD40 repeat-like protein [Dacryopinax primogenitus]EJT99024.1 WD40 repeat-like protein [Dacryopinax primogenitus]
MEAASEDEFPGEEEEEFHGFGSASSSGPEEDDNDDTDLSKPSPAPLSAPAVSSRKKAAWTDPSDSTLTVSLSSNRLRKLRQSAAEDSLSGQEYELRLRREFEKIQPAPEWAKPKRNKRVSEGEEGEEGIDSLLHGTADIVLPSSKSTSLPSGELQLTRLADANLSSPSSSSCMTSFHPSLSILSTASDRRLKLFSIDGARNPLLQSIHLPDLPLTKAVFNPQGTAVLCTGPRPFWYSYDLLSGQLLHSPRGLWGSPSAQNYEDGERSLEMCEFSPDGTLLAVGGRRGNIYFVDMRAGGASGQVLGSVKLNSAVTALQWTQPEGKEILAVGEEGEVYVFDVAARRCVRKWKDEGAFGASALAVSADGQGMALGARTGIVSLYDSSAMNTGMGQGNPKALRTVMNLTTRISCLKFNRSTEILCLASKDQKDQLRMVRIPVNTVFFNWPTSGTPLGHVTSVDFSASDEYAAIANTRGKVLLYQLRHYIQ